MRVMTENATPAPDGQQNKIAAAILNVLGRRCTCCGATDSEDEAVLGLYTRRGEHLAPIRPDRFIVLCADCRAAAHAAREEKAAPVSLTVMIDRLLYDALQGARPLSMTAVLTDLLTDCFVHNTAIEEELALYEERPDATIKLSVRIPQALRVSLMTWARDRGWTAKRAVHAILQQHYAHNPNPTTKEALS
jgi:hypothetical protein